MSNEKADTLLERNVPFASLLVLIQTLFMLLTCRGESLRLLNNPTGIPRG